MRANGRLLCSTEPHGRGMERDLEIWLSDSGGKITDDLERHIERVSSIIFLLHKLLTSGTGSTYHSDITVLSKFH